MKQVSKVVNLNNEEYDVYIGRGSLWGNPFIMGKDGNREEVINKYEMWVLYSEEERARLIREKIKELKGKILGCFCKPKKCHGDILVKLLNPSLNEFF